MMQTSRYFPGERSFGKGLLEYWGPWPGYVLFFLMLFVPSAYKPIKVTLLALVLGMIVVSVLGRGRVSVHRIVLLWTLLMVGTGLAFILRGLALEAPGAMRVGTVYVLWPLVYMVLVVGVAKRTVIDGLVKVIVLSSLGIELYTIFYLTHAMEWLPDALYIEIDQGQRMGLNDGDIRYSLYSLPSLLFCVPFLLASLMTWPNDRTMPVTRAWLWVAVVLGLGLVLLSGRRAIWLGVGIAPFIALAFRQFLPRVRRREGRKRVRRVVVASAIAIVGLYSFLQYTFGLDAHAMARMLSSAFDSSAEFSAYRRVEQFWELMEGWAERPLLGWGHGATVLGSLRSDEQPWAYELSYMALLFHTGAIGFLIYASGVAWIFWAGVKMIRSGVQLGLYMLPVLVGTSCFLIGNATNPYLAKYDYLWVIFLPVGLINFWLLTAGRSQQSPGVSLQERSEMVS